MSLLCQVRFGDFILDTCSLRTRSRVTLVAVLLTFMLLLRMSLREHFAVAFAICSHGPISLIPVGLNKLLRVWVVGGRDSSTARKTFTNFLRQSLVVLKGSISLLLSLLTLASRFQ